VWVRIAQYFSIQPLGLTRKTVKTFGLTTPPKILGLSVWLPFALRLADSDAALEIPIDASQIADQSVL